MENSLVDKLARVMSKIDRVPKNGKNEFFGYAYATEADVAEHCRKFLAEERIMLIPSVVGCEQISKLDKEGNTRNDIARLTVEFTFYDGDSSEKISFRVVADGEDRGDKATYKAITGAQKYALMKAFLIPTGDDPENDGEEKKQPQKASPASKKESNNPKVKAIIKEVTQKSGKGSKGDFVLYKITDHAGRVFQTFDTKIGEIALKEKETGYEMTIEYRTKEWQGKDNVKNTANEIVSIFHGDIPF